MPLPYDATLKDLAAASPEEFLAGLGGAQSLPVRLLNADLSTVTTATDITFGLGEPLEQVIHIDAQAGSDAAKHRELLAYNALLHRQYAVPVHSVLLLLRRQAQHSAQTGELRYAARPGLGKMEFGYQVIRLWEQPVEGLLRSGLATLPLAPLAQMPPGVPVEQGVRQALTEVLRRLEAEATPAMLRRLLTAALMLTGLRLDREQARSMFREISIMSESTTLQAVLDEGQLIWAHRVLLRQGQVKFGEPTETERLALVGIQDLDRLERLSERILAAANWQELLATP